MDDLFIRPQPGPVPPADVRKAHAGALRISEHILDLVCLHCRPFEIDETLEAVAGLEEASEVYGEVIERVCPLFASLRSAEFMAFGDVSSCAHVVPLELSQWALPWIRQFRDVPAADRRGDYVKEFYRHLGIAVVQLSREGFHELDGAIHWEFDAACGLIAGRPRLTAQRRRSGRPAAHPPTAKQVHNYARNKEWARLHNELGLPFKKIAMRYNRAAGTSYSPDTVRKAVNTFKPKPRLEQQLLRDAGRTGS